MKRKNLPLPVPASAPLAPANLGEANGKYKTNDCGDGDRNGTGRPCPVFVVSNDGQAHASGVAGGFSTGGGFGYGQPYSLISSIPSIFSEGGRI